MSFASFMRNQKTAIATARTTMSSTSFTDVTGVTFPVMANTIYLFQFDVTWQTTNTGVGIGLGVNGPAGTTFVVVRTEIPTSLTAVTQGLQRVYATGTTGGTATAAIDSPNVNNYAKCYGFVSIGGTAGTLALRIRSSAATQISSEVGTIGRLCRLSPRN